MLSSGLYPGTTLPLKAAQVPDKDLAWSCRPLLTQLVQVLVVEALALPVQVDGVVQCDGIVLLRGFRHELPEYADAAVPEDGLGQPAHHAPCSCLRVIGFQDIRELKGVVVATGDVELPAEHGHAAPNVDLEANTNTPHGHNGGSGTLGDSNSVSAVL